MPFRMSDKRRVQTVFDDVISAPYEAVVSLSVDYNQMQVVVTDPANEALNVAQCWWYFDTSAAAKVKQQPPPAEVASMAAAFETICQQYVAPEA